MKKTLLVVIDALCSRVVRPAVQQGRLPHLQQLIERGAVDWECVSVFPSITPAATAAICTGAYPAEHRIMGAYFFDREADKVHYYGPDFWVALEKGIADFVNGMLVEMNHNRLQSVTLHEMVESAGLETASLNYLLFRGIHTHKARIPWLFRLWPGVPWTADLKGPTTLCVGDFVQQSGSKRGNLSHRVPGGPFRRFGFEDEVTGKLLLQLDAFGEVMDALHLARRRGLEADDRAWVIQRHLVDYLETIWDQPDAGIWEMRTDPQMFTHSKVMAWVAVDRGIQAITNYGLPGDREKWKKLAQKINRDVCQHGFDSDAGTFTQSYGGKSLDAANLMIPLVGFLPIDDPRVQGTIQATERRLMKDGLVYRYDTSGGGDGLPGREGALLMCSFWLADNYALSGRMDEARALMDRLLGLRNDLGLLAEEFDPELGIQVGNFPQAFSHISLIDTAKNLSAKRGPSEDRGGK